jgi:hypothetical protein
LVVLIHAVFAIRSTHDSTMSLHLTQQCHYTREAPW